jgi:hypothetical protein
MLGTRNRYQTYLEQISLFRTFGFSLWNRVLMCGNDGLRSKNNKNGIDHDFLQSERPSRCRQARHDGLMMPDQPAWTWPAVQLLVLSLEVQRGHGAFTQSRAVAVNKTEAFPAVRSALRGGSFSSVLSFCALFAIAAILVASLCMETVPADSMHGGDILHDDIFPPAAKRVACVPSNGKAASTAPPSASQAELAFWDVFDNQQQSTGGEGRRGVDEDIRPTKAQCVGPGISCVVVPAASSADKEGESVGICLSVSVFVFPECSFFSTSRKTSCAARDMFTTHIHSRSPLVSTLLKLPVVFIPQERLFHVIIQQLRQKE